MLIYYKQTKQCKLNKVDNNKSANVQIQRRERREF